MLSTVTVCLNDFDSARPSPAAQATSDRTAADRSARASTRASDREHARENRGCPLGAMAVRRVRRGTNAYSFLSAVVASTRTARRAGT